MKKYKIYFDRDGIEPAEIVITGEGNNCRVGAVRVQHETIFFNCQGTLENILKKISDKLGKYGIKKIEPII
ncbi:MAG: hypothetical protein WC545_03925 [Patescibacteria group bacterium]|jgi:hypothetical protein